MSTTTTNADTVASTPDAESSSSLKVLIADKFEKSGMTGLEALGCQIQSLPDLNADNLPDAMKEHDPDVLIVRSTKVPEPVFEAADALSLVIRAGAGYDNINIEAASSRGIFVANCPGKNAIAVAELAWGLILGCDRRIPDATHDLRQGIWNKKGYAKDAKGLYGRTLGVIGLGRIGLEIAKRGKAFGMRVVAWSRSLNEERADDLGLGYCSSIINLVKMCDVISVNVAATPDTKHLINEQVCNSIKEGAYLINTSRGSVVDQDALAKAIQERNLRVGLDVYANQPTPSDQAFKDSIINEANVIGTHHNGASTEQAQNAIAAETVRIIEEYTSSGHVPNCVNRAASTPATSLLTVRHLNQPGVLAHVFYTLGQAGINVEEMENVIYDGAKAACARIQLDDVPADEILNTINTNDHVLSVTLANMPAH
ncbi:MAG: 3-phosphoglycerate dehydrogenase family protein [Planctomycetota bacterium]|nr:3-phosphoglycerate dehydrogenase family protein [Planctomycetota bacterium]